MEISANVNSNMTKPNKENNQLIVRPNFGLTTVNRTSARASVGVSTEEQPKLQAQVSQDTVQFGTSKVGTLLKSIPLFYMAGFALGFCPGLFLVASAAFLFSGKVQSFRHELATALMGNNVALQQLQVQFNKQNQEQQQTVQQADQPNVVADVEARDVTDVVDAENVRDVKEEEPEKEEKVLTPLERAQLKYARAKENQEKMSMQVERREQSEQVAQEKLEVAQARLDKAQEQYDKATAEVKAQMTDRMIKLQENVSKKDANARVAHERADLAKAQLAEATAKLAEAQRAFEDMQAEEMVEV